jgi:acyl-CoA synthetase (AMP-forming)/AMP-acid ligase II
MLYTSGTTGYPKGVKRNKPKLLSEALHKMRSGALTFGLCGDGPHLVTGPLYHAAPMLFALYDMLNGASVIVMPKWDIALFLDCLKKYQIHTTHLVPTMCVRLLHAHEKTPIAPDIFSTLKLVLHGAAPIAKDVKHKMINWWGPILVEYWGASEAGTTTLVNSEDWLSHPGTVGKPLAHFQVYVGDEAGNPVPDKEGLLFCKHQFLEQVFEYHHAPEKTLKAHPKPFTFCVGDIGRIDEDGFVYLSDRASNMIISGGVNIYPAEIEQVLIMHHAVADVVVFGVADTEWGENVKALIELKTGFQASDILADEIKQFAAGKIAKYKLPKVIDFIDSLPRNAAGKVRIKDLK